MQKYLRFIPFFLICSCSPSRPIDKMEWLLGSWENSAGDEKSIETWLQTDDSTYTGRSVSVIGTDTVWSETIRLNERDGNLYYEVTLADQNEGRPVLFRMVQSSEGKFVFENAEHDYPQRITYRRYGCDSLVTEIGNLSDPLKKQSFPMRRKPD